MCKSVIFRMALSSSALGISDREHKYRNFVNSCHPIGILATKLQWSEVRFVNLEISKGSEEYRVVMETRFVYIGESSGRGGIRPRI